MKKGMLALFTAILLVGSLSLDCIAAPAPPAMSYMANGLNLTATWASVPGATGYRLYYAPYPYREPMSIGSFDVGSTNSFSQPLWDGAAYYLAITAYDAQGESNLSNIGHFTMEASAYGAAGSISPMTVTGRLNVDATNMPVVLTLDNSANPIFMDSQNHFTISNVQNLDHSLFLRLEDGTTIEMPFRMAANRGLDLGEITIREGRLNGFSGFNGYHFGFVDENGDGINDNFVDANGDGICDTGRRFAGQPYLMNLGFVDANGDGINDNFVDADGDGVNDLNGMMFGYGFGWTDANGDGINDRFVDADGDGINDLNGMPYGHGFGWVDANGDGINDRFVDANGDGINDLTGRLYVAMPGWIDVNGDGINDRFVDADGDGVNDLNGMPYGHGFGWIDANGDDINDRFVDANGDGINDLTGGAYGHMAYHYGYQRMVFDANGDGIADNTGLSYRQCFGWVDSNGDGVNDNFVDSNGDGINDVTNRYYDRGFMMGPAGGSGPMMGAGNGGAMMGYGGR